MSALRRLVLALPVVPALLGLTLADSVVAQPAGPLTIVVPSTPGGAPDIMARLMAEGLRSRLNQTVIVENKPGAGGIVGAMAVKTAAANGNTVLLTHAAVVTITPLTYRAAKYDMARDFEAVAVVAETPMLFVAHPGTGFKTLAEALAQARSRPDALLLASPLRGTIPHLSGELLGISSGTRWHQVPMSSSGQAVQAVVNGDAQVSVDGIPPLLPLVKAGRVTALAVTANRVLPGLEDLPLAKDTVPGLTLTGWFMMFAPKGTPQARVNALNEAVNAAIRAPEFIQKLQAAAIYPVGGSTADARAFLVREQQLWARAVQQAGLKPE